MNFRRITHDEGVDMLICEHSAAHRNPRDDDERCDKCCQRRDWPGDQVKATIRRVVTKRRKGAKHGS